MPTPDSPAVRIGQVWADNDKRSAGRHVVVVAVDDTHATVEQLGQLRDGPFVRILGSRGRPAWGHADQQKAQPGRQTRIRLDRFRPTTSGYRHVSDPKD